MTLIEMTSERSVAIRAVLSTHGSLDGPVDSIAETASLYDAGLTSFASVSVMLGLEDAFDVEFPERMLKRGTFESIASIRDAIDALLAE
jgi:acyl carrier protein